MKRLRRNLNLEALESRDVPSFTPIASTPTETLPIALATGDFNRDGRLDLVVSNQVSQTVSIRLGAAGGTFTGTTNLAAPGAVGEIVVADFNRDGKLDFAAATGGGLFVGLGNGDGTFATSTPVSGFGTELAAGDFNGDGKLDLIRSAGFSANVLLCDGMGGFSSGAVLAFGSPVFGFAVGDINGDGKADVAAILPTTDEVKFVLGNGDGTFTSPTTLSVTNLGDEVALADFDRDGYLDLAARIDTGAGVRVFFNNGSGTFANPVALGSAPAKGMAILDANGDGNLDVVQSYGNQGDNLGIYLGNGDRTFAAAAFTADIPGALFALTAGDFTGDGKPDLAVIDNSNSLVRVLNNTYTFVRPNTFRVLPAVGVGDFTFSVTAGDFNRDGKLDFAATNNRSGTVSIRLGNGDGTFTSAADLTGLGSPWGITTGDFNRDGNLDLAIANAAGRDLRIFLGDGNGGFTAQATYPTPDEAIWVVAGDVNRDGILDLAVALGTSFIAPNGVQFFLGQGDGTFAQQAVFGDAYLLFAALADLDRDGDLDLATPLFSSGSQTEVATNDGSGAFAAGSPVSGVGKRWLEIGDFNGDGILDLAGESVAGVGVWLGSGSGTFTQQSTIAFPAQINAMASGDFNRDGKLDVVAAKDRRLTLFYGDGAGNLTAGPTFTIGSGVNLWGMTAGDVNGDGVLDLLVTTRTSDQVQVLLGSALAIDPAPASVSYSASSQTVNLTAAVTDQTGNVPSGTATFRLLDGQTVIGTATNGSISNGVATAVYTVPAGLAVGNYTVEVTFSGVTATDTFRVTNAAPSFTSTPVTSATEESKYSYAVAVVDPDSPAQNLTITGTLLPSWLTLTVTNNGTPTASATLTGTPGAADLGDHAVTLTLSDGVTSVTQSFTITVSEATRVRSIVRTTPVGPATNATSVTFTVTFSESVMNVDATDFVLALSGVTATTPVAVSGSGATYMVTVSGISGNGTLGLNLVDDGTISDATGNLLNLPTGTFTGQAYSIDQAAPTVTGVTSTTANGTYGVGKTVSVTVNFSEAVTLSGGNLVVNLSSGGTVVITPFTNSTTATGTYTVGAGQNSADLDSTGLVLTGGATLRDAVGIDAGLTIPCGQSLAAVKALVIDTTPPKVTISPPSVTFVRTGGVVRFTITFADANFNTSTLTAANIRLNRTGTANGTIVVTGTGRTRIVTIRNITGIGTLGISLLAGTASDKAGNKALAIGPSMAFRVGPLALASRPR